MADTFAEKLALRCYQYGEEARMAALVNASRGEEEGMTVTVDLIRDEWLDSRLNLARDTQVAVTERGEYVAATEVWFEDDLDAEHAEIIRHIGFTMHPSYRATYSELMETLFEQAIEHAHLQPRLAGKRYFLRAWASANDTWKHEWLLAHGFQYVHCGFTLLYDGTERIPAMPSIPGIRIEPGSSEREFELWQALNEAFSTDESFVPLSLREWSDLYQSSRQMDFGLWRIAIDEASDEIVGIALTEIADIAPDVGDPQEGWITDLGVLEGWRGRGIGKALLISALHGLRTLGIHAVLMGVDSQDPDNLVHLYESVGFRVLRGSCTYRRPMHDK